MKKRVFRERYSQEETVDPIEVAIQEIVEDAMEEKPKRGRKKKEEEPKKRGRKSVKSDK